MGNGSLLRKIKALKTGSALVQQGYRRCRKAERGSVGGLGLREVRGSARVLRDHPEQILSCKYRGVPEKGRNKNEIYVPPSSTGEKSSRQQRGVWFEST